MKIVQLTRMFKVLRQLEYLKKLDPLKLWTLEERKKNRADLLEVFKMLNGLIDIPLNTFFGLNSATSTRGHIERLVKHSCRRD